nr:hypothetical protein [Halobacteriovorax sp. HLS]
MIAHGLNLNPEKMEVIGSIFKERKVTPIYVKLTGHTKNSNWEAVSADRWRKDFYKGLCQAFLISKNSKVPMYAFGYSLGSVLIQDAVEKFKAPFAKVFHISPAFKTRWYVGFITGLFKLGFTFNIPSSNYEDYRAQSNTSLVAYKSMYELNQGLKYSDELENFIFMDLRDELVDYTNTKHLCEMKKNCKFTELKNTPFDRGKKIYHLSLDPQSAGLESWQLIRKTILSKL